MAPIDVSGISGMNSQLGDIQFNHADVLAIDLFKEETQNSMKKSFHVYFRVKVLIQPILTLTNLRTDILA